MISIYGVVGKKGSVSVLMEVRRWCLKSEANIERVSLPLGSRQGHADPWNQAVTRPGEKLEATASRGC